MCRGYERAPQIRFSAVRGIDTGRSLSPLLSSDASCVLFSTGMIADVSTASSVRRPQLLAAATDGSSSVRDQRLEPRQRSKGASQEYRYASRVYGFSRRRRDCRRSGSRVWCTHATRTIGLILVMLGAIQKKIFVWHTGFWGEKASGWHYDLMLVVMNIVIACSGGGKYVLWR